MWGQGRRRPETFFSRQARAQRPSPCFPTPCLAPPAPLPSWQQQPPLPPRWGPDRLCHLGWTLPAPRQGAPRRGRRRHPRRPRQLQQHRAAGRGWRGRVGGRRWGGAGVGEARGTRQGCMHWRPRRARTSCRCPGLQGMQWPRPEQHHSRCLRDARPGAAHPCRLPALAAAGRSSAAARPPGSQPPPGRTAAPSWQTCRLQRGAKRKVGVARRGCAERAAGRPYRLRQGRQPPGCGQNPWQKSSRGCRYASKFPDLAAERAGRAKLQKALTCLWGRRGDCVLAWRRRRGALCAASPLPRCRRGLLRRRRRRSASSRRGRGLCLGAGPRAGVAARARGCGGCGGCGGIAGTCNLRCCARRRLLFQHHRRTADCHAARVCNLRRQQSMRVTRAQLAQDAMNMTCRGHREARCRAADVRASMGTQPCGISEAAGQRSPSPPRISTVARQASTNTCGWRAATGASAARKARSCIDGSPPCTRPAGSEKRHGQQAGRWVRGYQCSPAQAQAAAGGAYRAGMLAGCEWAAARRGAPLGGRRKEARPAVSPRPAPAHP